MTEHMVDTTPAITPDGSAPEVARPEDERLGGATAALPGPKPASTAELVRRASEQVTQLVRDEVALAKVEMATKAKRMGVGGGLFGGAGALAFYGLGAAIAAAALALDIVLPAWAAALIVAGGLFLIAAIMALIGRVEVRRAGKPMPDQTIDSVKTDMQTVTHAVKEGRR